MNRLVQFALLALLMAPILAQGQDDEFGCGTTTTPEALSFMTAAQEGYLTFSESFVPGVGEVETKPIQVHLINRSDGTGGLTEAQFEAALTELNDYFSNANLFFQHCGPVNVINSDTYFNFDTSEEAAFFSQHGVANVINIVIPGGNLTVNLSGQLCGYAYLPQGGRDLIAVKRSCMFSGNTFTHEMGHYFGLYHTHGKNNCGSLTDELVDGSNCASAGDDVCDTPADPGLLGIGCTGYVVNSNCQYTGSLTDSQGQVFQPDPSNIMSYAPGSCRNSLTTGQYARMNYFAANGRDNLNCSTSPPPPAGAGETCAEAIELTASGTYTANGPSSGNGCQNCSGGASQADWFYFDAPANGTLSISSCFGGVNTRLWAYTGSCGALNSLASSDDACVISPNGAPAAAELAFNVSAGTRYYFEWDNRWSTDGFDFEFSYVTPCTPPVGVSTAAAGYSSIVQQWAPIDGNVIYNVRHRAAGAVNWITETVYNPRHILENLMPCSTYEWQVQSVCNDLPGNWSATYTLNTQGCNDPYCYSYGNSTTAWISNISLAGLNYPSGNEYGYANFTNQTATVTQGQNYVISLNSDDIQTVPVFWRVWIDFNNDNDFSDVGELVVTTTTNSGSLASAAVTIPQTASIGTVRMRASMSLDGFPTACQAGGNMDVEDYSVQIEGINCPAPPTPSVQEAGVSYAIADWGATAQADEYQLRYREVGSFSWIATTLLGSNSTTLYNLQPCTDYEVQARANCGGTFSSFSGSATFSTTGCGAAYCYAYGSSATTWIDRIALGNIDNVSGNNFGYGDFTAQTTTVVPGGSYQAFLKAASTQGASNVFWRIWIDRNQDNDFNDGGELIFEGSGGNNSTLNASLAIPGNTTPGATRLRISMSPTSYSQPCSVNGEREVEDYQVIVEDPLFLTVAPASITLPFGGGQAQFSISANTSWTVIENAAWMNLAPATGNGSATITLSAQPNASTQSRQVAVIVTGAGVADQTIMVMQEGAPAALSVSPPTQQVPAAAGQTALQVASNVTWAAASDQAWATVGQASGSGNFSLPVSYAANSSSSSRTAVITLSSPGLPSQTATIIQAAGAAPPVLNITPANQQVSADAGQASYNISSNTSWEASTADSWITLQPLSGNGNGTLAAAYTANPAPTPRTGSITLTANGLPPQTVTLEQAGDVANEVLDVTPSSLTVNYLANCVTFDVMSNLAWTVSTNAPWINSIAPSSGMGNGTVTVCYETNSTEQLRTGTLEFTGGSLLAIATLNQAPENLTPPWPINTSSNNTHTVVVPDTLYSNINGAPLQGFDWIGFFYTDLSGTLRCAGAGRWDSNANTAITVYGDDTSTPGKEGFDEGEPFTLRVFRNIEQDTLLAEAAFAPVDAVISHEGRFNIDGLSKLDSLTAFAENEPWFVNQTGANHSVILPTGLFSDIDGALLNTNDWIGFFFADGDTLKCAGQGQWDPLNNTVVTVYGDDAQTPEKDGFSANEMFQVMVYRTNEQEAYPAAAEYAQPDGFLITHTDTFATDGISLIETITVTLDVTQDIILRENWNTISSYVMPEDLSLPSIFAPVSDDIIIVKDEAGNSFIPAFNINDIGLFDNLKGYQVKMTQERVLSVTGSRVPEDTPLPLVPGWQISAYLLGQPSPADVQLGGLFPSLVIAKNSGGDTYIPVLAINDIGELMPGQGYHIRMASPDTLRYSPENFAPGVGTANLGTAPGIIEDRALAAPLGLGQKSGHNATFVLPSEVASRHASPGDRIALLSESGALCGSKIYRGSHLALTAWGDDPSTTEAIEGLKAGEEITLQVWKGEQPIGRSFRMALRDGSGTAHYETDGLQVIRSLESKGGAEEAHTAFCYPNPVQDIANLQFYSDIPGNAQIALVNLQGQAIRSWQHECAKGWNPVQLSLQAPSGLYLLKIDLPNGASQSLKLVAR
ncbi:GEVED domain-containing protein [Phaeodactylibacter luteus]|nr:GEVED domain-containing protein [Phaeodactylibacter luteus]